jgi:hypothetical protein
MTKAEPPGRERVELTIQSGYAYHTMWFGLLSFGGMALLAGLAPAPPEQEPNRIWFVLGFGLFAALFVLGVMHYHGPRTLVAEADGVRLLRGERVLREIPWEQATWLVHGTRVLTSWVLASREGYLFRIRGRRPWLRIAVDNVVYRMPEHELAAFAAAAAQMAATRGVAVDKITHGEATRGRLALRIFGERFNAGAAFASAISGLFVLLSLWMWVGNGRTVGIVGLAISGPLTAYFAWVAVVSRRLYCPKCGTHRMLVPRGGGWRCGWCGNVRDKGG